LDPKNAEIADTLGWVFYRKGHYDSAFQYLQTAASSESPQVKYHLAMAYMKVGDSKRGMQVLLEALQKAPNAPEAAMARMVLLETRKGSQ
jgi:Tfp pilus assembly protein PilF